MDLVGAVVVGGLDDPDVLVGADGGQVGVLGVEEHRLGHRVAHEGALLLVEERKRARIVQHAEDLLIVDEVAGEAADEGDFLGAHGLDEVL